MANIRVGIAGAGGIASVHSKAYLNLSDVTVVGVADCRIENAMKLAEPHGAKSYASLEEMLDNELLDVLDVCTPTCSHPEMTIKAAERKIHVLCEKPIALDILSAQSMIDACESNGVLFMVAHVIRFWPEYVYLKRIYEEKTYGELKEAFFSRLSPAPKWCWERWMLSPEKSGGALVDLHIHDADYIIHLLGKPEAVTSFGTVDDADKNYILTSYRYADKIVTAEGGWYDTPIPFRMSFRAVFEQAAIEFMNKDLMIYPVEGEPQKLSFDGTFDGASGINVDIGVAYQNEIRYFLDCVRKGTKPVLTTPASSRDSLELVHLEAESARAGAAIFWKSITDTTNTEKTGTNF